jgi:hypothetical protein
MLTVNPMLRRNRSIQGILYCFGLLLAVTFLNSHMPSERCSAAAFAATAPPVGDAATRSSPVDANDPANNVEESESSSVPLLLPPSNGKDGNITSIQLGETISFDQLGPIILNTDGTTRRIDNWNEMTQQEQETTWRRIKKRNAERRKVLLEQQELEQRQQQNVSQAIEEL